MTEKDLKIPPDGSLQAGESTERRRSSKRSAPPKPDPKAVGTVGHDDQGNAVWNWRVDVPRRRDDDPTIDLIDCLDVDGMSIEDEESDDTEEKFNPYNKPR